MAVQTLRLEGAVTIRTVGAVLEQARAVGGTDGEALRIDCRRVTHADAAGLQVLLALRGTRAGGVVVEHVPAELAWRFRYVGLDPD
jgi:ABC-type transporter Mla MlaB component